MFNAHLAIKRFLLLFWQPVFILLVQLNEQHSELYSKYEEKDINISSYIIKLVVVVYYRRIKTVFPKFVDLEIRNILDLSESDFTKKFEDFENYLLIPLQF